MGDEYPAVYVEYHNTNIGKTKYRVVGFLVDETEESVFLQVHLEDGQPQREWNSSYSHVIPKSRIDRMIHLDVS